MAEEKKNLFTREGLEELEKELIYRKEDKKREISEKLKEARGHGDLSENAEYEAALEEQRDNDAKIIELEAILKDAEVADEGDIDNNRISFGCTVTVLDKETKEELTYTIKGANEVGSVAGVISNESPLGKALMGAKKGQTVDVECPVGVLKYKVLKFTREKKAE